MPFPNRAGVETLQSLSPEFEREVDSDVTGGRGCWEQMDSRWGKDGGGLQWKKKYCPAAAVVWQQGRAATWAGIHASSTLQINMANAGENIYALEVFEASL